MNQPIPSDKKLNKITGILAVALFASAFSLVYIKDMNRRLTSERQRRQKISLQQQDQYTQLVLEKSAWTSNARIESIAAQKLHMITPPGKSVVMIKDGDKP